MSLPALLFAGIAQGHCRPSVLRERCLVKTWIPSSSLLGPFDMTNPQQVSKHVLLVAVLLLRALPLQVLRWAVRLAQAVVLQRVRESRHARLSRAWVWDLPHLA